MKYSIGFFDEEVDASIAMPFIAHRLLDGDQWAHLYNNQSDPSDFWDTSAAVEDGPFT